MKLTVYGKDLECTEEMRCVADCYTEQDAQTIAHRVNVHDELVAALAGMLAINDSVTQGQEREYREKFLPMARAALERAKP